MEPALASSRIAAPPVLFSTSEGRPPLVVSLGGHCQTAWQIERRLGHAPPGPFNSIGTPWSALLHILSGAKLPFDYRVHESGEGLIETTLRTRHVHEFTRDKQGWRLNESAGHQCRRRIEAMAKRLDDLLRRSDAALFVRLHGDGDVFSLCPYVVDPRPLTANHLRALADVIGGRWPNLSWRLALAYYPRSTQIAGAHERVDLHPLAIPADPAHPDHGWRGDDHSWDRLFDSYGLPHHSVRSML